jgi:hypothetical protein
MADGFSEPSGGSGAGGAYTATDDAGFDNFFEKVRQSLVSLGHSTYYLGGSRTSGFVGTSYTPIVDYVDFDIPAAKDGGAFTWTAEIDLLSGGDGTTITPRVRNVTDGTTAVTGSATTSTSFARQSLSFTPTVGKCYRIECVKSNDTETCWAIGYMQRVAP